MRENSFPITRGIDTPFVLRKMMMPSEKSAIQTFFLFISSRVKRSVFFFSDVSHSCSWGETSMNRLEPLITPNPRGEKEIQGLSFSIRLKCNCLDWMENYESDDFFSFVYSFCTEIPFLQLQPTILSVLKVHERITWVVSLGRYYRNI